MATEAATASTISKTATAEANIAPALLLPWRLCSGLLRMPLPRSHPAAPTEPAGKSNPRETLYLNIFIVAITMSEVNAPFQDFKIMALPSNGLSGDGGRPRESGPLMSTDKVLTAGKCVILRDGARVFSPADAVWTRLPTDAMQSFTSRTGSCALPPSAAGSKRSALVQLLHPLIK